jgi:DHHC palmitoyltransferase
VSLIRTATMDPGIIPPAAAIPGSEEIVTFNARTPQTQHFVVHGKPITLRHCATCNLYRPPRAVHCYVCDCCVEVMDHHCPWVGNCIGKRNYKWFSAFLYSATSLCVLVCGSCIHLIVVHTHEENDAHPNRSNASNFLHAIENPVACLLALYSFVAIFFVFGLCVFHAYLTAIGQTTNERLKRLFPFGSPHSRGAIVNFFSMFCSMEQVTNFKVWKQTDGTTHNEDGVVEHSLQHIGHVPQESAVDEPVQPAQRLVKGFPAVTLVDAEETHITYDDVQHNDLSGAATAHTVAGLPRGGPSHSSLHSTVSSIRIDTDSLYM